MLRKNSLKPLAYRRQLGRYMKANVVYLKIDGTLPKSDTFPKQFVQNPLKETPGIQGRQRKVVKEKQRKQKIPTFSKTSWHESESMEVGPPQRFTASSHRFPKFECRI
ncbi:hypothetical protein CDAR_29901 [Caerostris darwini]|uniref:Uncharacterized protein n=1 Tax=Caerostris darwini TaxID=1538125 RepID=A0AAV4NT22_9ARAC|nr:hypothetical protein CDAR_91241 [Caerostris darwini]GIY16196.1 hypothetical protein CDAR_29901 [Caerostris darwini]